MRVQEQVLRVSDRRQHAAEVCGHGLQHDDVDQLLFPVGHAEHDDGEGHEGQ